MPGVVQFGGKARPRGARLEPAQGHHDDQRSERLEPCDRARIENRDFLTRFALTEAGGRILRGLRRTPQTSKVREKGLVTERQKERDGLGARLDPEVRSWIRNVIVPAMVREYLAEHGGAIVVAEPNVVVPQCKANARLSAEGIP
jgi:hypothetical protein